MRVVLVEDQLLLLDAVSRGLPLLNVDVVGQARTEAEALRVIADAAPDVAIVDIRLPPTQTDEGLRIAEAVRDRQPGVGLLVLSSHAEISHAERLLSIEEDARAIGYVDKDQAGDLTRLVDTLHRIADGDVVIDSRIVERLLKRRRHHDPLAALTPTERRVLALMAQGLSNSGIALETGQTTSAVEKAISAISGKLGLPTKETPERRGVNLRVLAVLAYLRATDGHADR